jgi:hypothetical protein
MNTQGRYWNVILGLWLFFSAFLWPHDHPQFLNTLIAALVTVVVSVIAFGVPTLRFASAFTGIWLVVSWFVLGRGRTGTGLNNVIVGLAIMSISLLPSTDLQQEPLGPEPRT